MLSVNALVDPSAQFCFGDFAWLVKNHRGERSLAPFLAGNAEDCYFAHCRMLHNDLFDIFGKDVDAAGDDQIFLAVNEVKKTVRIDVAEVARVQPTIHHSLHGSGCL